MKKAKATKSKAPTKKPAKKAKKAKAPKKWSDKPRNKMVGFWLNEAELKAFDAALVKNNWTKPNGKANRAGYLKTMADALINLGKKDNSSKSKTKLAESGKL